MVRQPADATGKLLAGDALEEAYAGVRAAHARQGAGKRLALEAGPADRTRP
jgi:hypothetical protein